MADSFIPLDSYRSVQSTTGTQSQDVEVITAATIPNGIVFTYAVPLIFWKDGSYASTLNRMADLLESFVSEFGVVGGTPSQDFDTNNLLANFVDLTLSVPAPNMTGGTLTGVASVPITSVLIESEGVAARGVSGVELATTYVHDEYNRLVALAGE